ncbi:MAG TPA: hypothetical protein VNH64_02595 [Parvularculaceae bacterium]|nr:hypothetical protein [Parvularculaceae bacterium]
MGFGLRPADAAATLPRREPGGLAKGGTDRSAFVRDAFIIVGIACALVGILLRQREGPMRGLATALIIVGLILIFAIFLLHGRLPPTGSAN